MRRPSLERVVVVAWCTWMAAMFLYLVHGFATMRYLWWLP